MKLYSIILLISTFAIISCESNYQESLAEKQLKELQVYAHSLGLTNEDFSLDIEDKMDVQPLSNADYMYWTKKIEEFAVEKKNERIRNATYDEVMKDFNLLLEEGNQEKIEDFIEAHPDHIRQPIRLQK